MAAELLQSVANRGVEDRIAHPHDDPTDDVRVHARCQRDVASRAPPDRLTEARGGLLVERDRAGDLDGQGLVLLLPQPLVLVADPEENRHPVVFDQQGEEVQQDLIGVYQQRVQRTLLLFGAEVGREEEHPQLAVALQGVRELAQLLAQLVQLSVCAGHLEQRAAIYPGQLLHQFCDAPEETFEKSSSLSACSTSLRWSSSSSVLRVTFSVAMIVRSATSLRMSSSARCVAASISRSARLEASVRKPWPWSLASFSWVSA